jgi:hypothetical protein
MAAGNDLACWEKQLLPHRAMKTAAAKISLGWTTWSNGV